MNNSCSCRVLQCNHCNLLLHTKGCGKGTSYSMRKDGGVDHSCLGFGGKRVTRSLKRKWGKCDLACHKACIGVPTQLFPIAENANDSISDVQDHNNLFCLHCEKFLTLHYRADSVRYWNQGCYIVHRCAGYSKKKIYRKVNTRHRNCHMACKACIVCSTPRKSDNSNDAECSSENVNVRLSDKEPSILTFTANTTEESVQDTDSKITDRVTVDVQNESCPICTEPTPRKIGLALLPCTHAFHSACIAAWFRISSSCPICRMAITNAQFNVKVKYRRQPVADHYLSDGEIQENGLSSNVPPRLSGRRQRRRRNADIDLTT